MTSGLTQAALQPVIDTRPELVEQALRVTYDDPQVIQDLATLRATAENGQALLSIAIERIATKMQGMMEATEAGLRWPPAGQAD